MKLIKIFFLSFLAASFAFPVAAGASIAVPAGQHIFPPYGPVVAPVFSADPGRVMPIGLGPAATGGATAALRIGIGQFSGEVDLYVGIYAPAIDPNNIFALMSDNVTLTPVPLGTLAPNGTLQFSLITFPPWRANTLGDINETVLSDIPVISLPQGTYSLFLLATPARSLDSGYLWRTTAILGDNVVPVTVNGALCRGDSYPNKPCVSVTVCTPGTTICQRIDDVLLDTGSYGLRIFKQALTIAFDQVNLGSGDLAECVHYGDGSANWGPVQTADVVLGNEPVIRIPIQVIDHSFGDPPFACKSAEPSPDEAGYTGILGVGPFKEDCGPICSGLASNGMYYACSGSVCSPIAVALPDQVPNPVARLPLDNNGAVVRLPVVSPNGAPSASGYLLLGVGTRDNNIPSDVTAYDADQNGEISTTFNGSPSKSFFDTGSNGIFFPAASTGLLPLCPWPNNSWYCPPSAVNFSAINMGASGTSSGNVSFQIGNFISQLSSLNSVFSNIGGVEPENFDWGLPFFFGKDVFLGIEGTASDLGSGPYWAY